MLQGEKLCRQEVDELKAQIDVERQRLEQAQQLTYDRVQSEALPVIGSDGMESYMQNLTEVISHLLLFLSTILSKLPEVRPTKTRSENIQGHVSSEKMKIGWSAEGSYKLRQ